MPRKRQASRETLELLSVRVPQGWKKRIEDMLQDKQSVSNFICELLYPAIDRDVRRPLLPPPLWGKHGKK